MTKFKHMPSYHPSLGKVDPATYLQKLNINGKNDIEMFSGLLQFETPTIPYKTALSLATANSAEDEFAFRTFIQRLESMNSGIIRNTVDNFNYVPQYVRLCDEDAPIFYTEYISELTNQTMISPEKNIPTRNEFKVIGFALPKKIVIPLEESHIYNALKNEALIDQLQDNEAIYSLKLNKRDILFLTDYSIPKLPEICMSRLREILNDPNILPMIVKAANLDLDESKRNIESLDYRAWSEFISPAYLTIPSLIDNPQISAYSDVFNYIAALNTLLKLKIAFEKSRVQNKQAVESFQEFALNALLVKDRGVPLAQLKHFLIGVGQRNNIEDKEILEQSIEEFLSQFFTSSADPNPTMLKKNEICVELNGVCLHSSIVTDILADNFDNLTNTLRNYFVNLLKKYLENRLPIKENVFLNEETLEIATHQKVNEIDNMYALILNSPILLAGLLTKKSNLNAKFASMASSRRLSMFFNLRTKELLPWHKIFDVNLSSFTEEAYKKISWVRRYWMIFTGQYRTMSERIAKLERLTSTMEVDKHDLIEFNKNLLKKKGTGIDKSAVKIKAG